MFYFIPLIVIKVDLIKVRAWVRSISFTRWQNLGSYVVVDLSLGGKSKTPLGSADIFMPQVGHL